MRLAISDSLEPMESRVVLNSQMSGNLPMPVGPVADPGMQPSASFTAMPALSTTGLTTGGFTGGFGSVGFGGLGLGGLGSVGTGGLGSFGGTFGSIPSFSNGSGGFFTGGSGARGLPTFGGFFTGGLGTGGGFTSLTSGVSFGGGSSGGASLAPAQMVGNPMAGASTGMNVLQGLGTMSSQPFAAHANLSFGTCPTFCSSFGLTFFGPTFGSSFGATGSTFGTTGPIFGTTGPTFVIGRSGGLGPVVA